MFLFRWLFLSLNVSAIFSFHLETSAGKFLKMVVRFQLFFCKFPLQFHLLVSISLWSLTNNYQLKVQLNYIINLV